MAKAEHMRAAIHAADAAKASWAAAPPAERGRILHRAADELEKGTPELVELLNGPTVHDEATVPFGGVKDSGMGREGGRWSIEEMTEVRWVTIHLGKRPYPSL